MWERISGSSATEPSHGNATQPRAQNCRRMRILRHLLWAGLPDGYSDERLYDTAAVAISKRRPGPANAGHQTAPIPPMQAAAVEMLMGIMRRCSDLPQNSSLRNIFVNAGWLTHRTSLAARSLPVRSMAIRSCNC